MLIHTIAKKIKSVELLLQNIYFSASGFVKVLILSKYTIRLPIVKQEHCIVLGNGPSLKQSFEQNNFCFVNTPLICVNHFATSQEFCQYKPSYYVMLDPGFFILKQRSDVIGTFNALKKNVNWELNLFVPYLYRNDVDLKFLKEHNLHVKIHYFNYTVVKGFDFLAFYLFKKNLAMPQFYNVLGASIFLAINMGFKKIWVTGADHSWFKDIQLDDDNVLCMEDKHFYDTGKKPLIKFVDPFLNRQYTMGDFFHIFSRVFNSYYLLNRYALYRNNKIYNASEHSYIDAFERKKITDLTK
jgi:hypothetical protein